MVYHKASSCPARCGPATTLPALRLDMATLMIALLGVSGFPRRTAAALQMIGALMCRTRGVRTLKMSHDAVECDAVAFGRRTRSQIAAALCAHFPGNDAQLCRAAMRNHQATRKHSRYSTAAGSVFLRCARRSPQHPMCPPFYAHRTLTRLQEPW